MLFADELHEHLARGADLMRADGLTPARIDWIERSHALVMRQELVAAKTSLARALLEGADVTDACLALCRQHVERYGPVLRLLGAA